MKNLFQKDLINLISYALLILLVSYLITFSISYIFINNIFEIVLNKTAITTIKIIAVLTNWAIIIHLVLASIFRNRSSKDVEDGCIGLFLVWVLIYCCHIYIFVNIVGASIT